MATQYTTASSGSGAIATLSLSQGIAFGGAASGAAPAAFTVGGWVRVTALPNGDQVLTVFGAGSDFRVLIDSAGTLGLIAAGGSVNLSGQTIQPGGWHYVAATYAQSATYADGGTAQLVLDGVIVLNPSVPANPSGGNVYTQVTLGNEGQGLEFASWSIWTEVLDIDALASPTWGLPPAGSEDSQDLLAAFDFASGAPTDITGSGSSATVAATTWYTPCLEVQAGGYASPSSEDTAVPGEASAFSVLGWINVGRSEGTYTLVTNGDASGVYFSVAATVASVTSPPTLTVTRTGATIASVTLPEAGTWVHVGVTYDGSTFTVYVNGTAATTAAASGLAAITNNIMIGDAGALSPTPYFIQEISFWNIAVSAAQLQSVMNGTPPIGETGCLSFFAFEDDSVNEITLNAATLQALVSILTLASQSGSTALALPVPRPNALEPDPLRLYTHRELKAMAARHGIDVTSVPSDAEVAAGQYADADAMVGRLVADLPAARAKQYRDAFRRNVRIGLDLQRRGIREGSFEVRREGDRAVVYFHNQAGPQRITDFQGGDEWAEWCMQIFLDIVTVVVAIFGIYTTAAKVVTATRTFARLGSTVGNAARAARMAGGSSTMQAVNSVINTMGAISNAGSLYALFKAIIIASWWSFLFTVISIVLQILAMVLSGGLALAAKVALIGVSVATLISDLTNMPSSSN